MKLNEGTLDRVLRVLLGLNTCRLKIKDSWIGRLHEWQRALSPKNCRLPPISPHSLPASLSGRTPRTIAQTVSLVRVGNLAFHG